MIPTLETEIARQVFAVVSEKDWLRRVVEAQTRAALYDMVVTSLQPRSLRGRVATYAPQWTWSQFMHLRRRVKAGTGPVWERLLDLRLPPVPAGIADDVRLFAESLRRVDRSMGSAAIQQRLLTEFGERGKISKAALKRILAQAGLSWRPVVPVTMDESEPAMRETVTVLSGGGGLALLGAAAAETEIFSSFAAQLPLLRVSDESLPPVEPLHAAQGPRDDQGRFAPGYNEHYVAQSRKDNTDDPRWNPQQLKRPHRAINSLQLFQLPQRVTAARMMAIAVIPLVTESRGFDGLSAISGDWLRALDIFPYLPTTLDKTLSELALANAGSRLWDVHTNHWRVLADRWSANGPEWLQYVIYVDTTQDPYWTSRFARSGKVSRTNSTQPCLSRILVTSGPGVPIIVDTVAGSVSLRSRLRDVLQKLDQTVGDGVIGRITVVDAEIATAPLLDSLALDENRSFITVLKGPALHGATFTDHGDWIPYREHDQVREACVVLKKSYLHEHGITLRAVQMRRPESSNPTVTSFVTDMPVTAFDTKEVADAYLARWPYQEHHFRTLRNGGGWERSYGFSGENVAHVAIVTQRQKAERSVAYAQVQLDNADDLLRQADTTSAKIRASLTTARNQKSKLLKKASEQLARLNTMPETIYQRDTTSTDIATVLTLTMTNLVRQVLTDYFDGLRMELRTFIQQLVALPVTIRENELGIRYQIARNPRNPQLMRALDGACERINTRNIRQRGKLVSFELQQQKAAS
jgi:hypothetical protein